MRSFANLKTSYPYRNLSREQFDLVLNMLAGRYADSRVRELKPLVSIDRLDNTVARTERGASDALSFRRRHPGPGVFPSPPSGDPCPDR